MAVLWVHSGGWLSPAAISYIGIHNGLSFALIGEESHLLMPSKNLDCDFNDHLRDFYGVIAPENYKIELVNLRRRWWDIHNPYYKYAYQYARALRRKLPPQEPLLVLTREPRFLPYLAELSSCSGIKGLYESHYFYYDLGWREGTVSRGDGVRSKLERNYIKRISGIIAIASQQALLYKKNIPEVPVCFAPLGAKQLRNEQTSVGQEKVWFDRRMLVYIGHLLSYKGIDDLVSYGSRLKDKNIKAFFLGGRADEVERYKTWADNCGANHLLWQPFLSPGDMFTRLSQLSSVGILALQDNFYDRNLTCPVKALDFLSLGLPVVASDLPCTRDVLGESGVYFKAGDMASMLESVTALLESYDFYKDKCRQARARAIELSWPERAKKIMEFSRNIGR